MRTESPLPVRGEAVTPGLVEALGERGWFVSDALISREAASATATLARNLELRPAAIRREKSVDPTVRTDETAWLDDSPLHPAFRSLRDQLNCGAYLGLGRFDVQLARYAPAAAYARHRDAFPGPGNRRLTAIVYLNAQWQPGHGGELRLHVGPAPVDVEPRLGRLVVFLSEQIEHEVLTAWAPRLAATAWFYGP